jgi:hypothetical protein
MNGRAATGESGWAGTCSGGGRCAGVQGCCCGRADGVDGNCQIPFSWWLGILHKPSCRMLLMFDRLAVGNGVSRCNVEWWSWMRLTESAAFPLWWNATWNRPQLEGEGCWLEARAVSNSLLRLVGAGHTASHARQEACVQGLKTWLTSRPEDCLPLTQQRNTDTKNHLLLFADYSCNIRDAWLSNWFEVYREPIIRH